MANRRTMDRPRGEGLASTLAARGIAVMNVDLRGHGESGPGAREGGRWSYDDIVGDVHACVAAARARFPGARVTVVGHSLGGHAALIAAGLEPARAPDAIVGLAANMWLPHLDPSLFRRVGKRALMAAWLGVAALQGGRFDPRRLGIGSDAEPWPYVAQLVRTCVFDRLTSADGRVDYRAAIGRASLPYLSIASEGDAWLGNPEVIARWNRLAKNARLTERRVLRGELGGQTPDHMGLVTNPASRPLWQEIAIWILEQR
jgi:predicted alpha/beta hydrolase